MRQTVLLGTSSGCASNSDFGRTAMLSKRWASQLLKLLRLSAAIVIFTRSVVAVNVRSNESLSRGQYDEAGYLRSNVLENCARAGGASNAAAATNPARIASERRIGNLPLCVSEMYGYP